MQDALDNLDMDGMEAVRDSLSQYRYEGQSRELFKKLSSAIEELNPDDCEAIMKEWNSNL